MRIQVEIVASTQYATAYCDGAPFATVQRRRVADKTSPVWTAYDLDGDPIGHAMNAVAIRFALCRYARAILRGVIVATA